MILDQKSGVRRSHVRFVKSPRERGRSDGALLVCLLRPPRSFARSAARGRCRSAFRHEYVRPKTACHSLCLSAQLPSEDVQRTSVEIGNHRNTLLRHKGRVNQVEVAMSLVQEGASLRTGACNRAEHQRQRWHDPLRLSFPFRQPTHPRAVERTSNCMRS